jgi:hypothetical protein
VEETTQELTPLNNINKIEYTLLWLTNNVQLRIGVHPYNVSKKHGRSSYYREVQYFNKQFQQDFVNVQLSPETYLALCQISEKNGYKADIKMNFQMAMTFRTSLETLYNVLNAKYNEFYAKVDDEHCAVIKRITPLEMKTMYGAPLILYPDIVNYENGSTGGVRIVMGDPNNSIVVPLDTIQSMYQCIASIDFFSYGLQMVQLACQPKFGDNRYVMDDKKPRRKSYFHK